MSSSSSTSSLARLDERGLIAGDVVRGPFGDGEGSTDRPDGAALQQEMPQSSASAAGIIVRVR